MLSLYLNGVLIRKRTPCFCIYWYAIYVHACIFMDHGCINAFVMYDILTEIHKRVHLLEIMDQWVWRRHQEETLFLLIMQEILQHSTISREIMILSVACIVVLFLKMFLMLLPRKTW